MKTKRLVLAALFLVTVMATASTFDGDPTPRCIPGTICN